MLGVKHHPVESVITKHSPVDVSEHVVSQHPIDVYECILIYINSYTLMIIQSYTFIPL